MARNNELIAGAAERVAAGERPRYDDRAAVDEAALRAYAGEAGGMPGLADAFEASARRLAAVRKALDESTAEYPVHVVIWDSGELVSDGPVPIGRFIEGNTTFPPRHVASRRTERPLRRETST